MEALKPRLSSGQWMGEVCGRKELKDAVLRVWQQVYGGVKRRTWSRRSPRTTVLCRGACLGRGRVFPAPIRARTCAAVLGAEVRDYTELEEISTRHVLHARARLDTP